MSKKLEELKLAHAAMKKLLSEQGKDAVVEVMRELLTQHPCLAAVRWAQYTPYFNDGDPCKFRVCEPYVKWAGESVDDEDDGFEYYYEYYYEDGTRDEDQKKAGSAVETLFGGLPEDLMLAAFGDHAQVTATRDGLDVEEYSHD